jgi:hypothetical protein
LNYHIRTFKQKGLVERVSPEGKAGEWRLHFTAADLA